VFLGLHVAKTHEMSCDVYREEFSLNAGLVGCNDGDARVSHLPTFDDSHEDHGSRPNDLRRARVSASLNSAQTEEG